MVRVVCLVLALATAVAADHDPRDFENDKLLPGYHFVPWPYDWMNDPNGPLYDPVHDMYHLFYQYQTPRMWGHAASPNLVDWVQLPMALTRQNSYDSGGDFSGSATVLDDENQTPVLTVSSSSNNVVFIAVPEDRSDPYLTNWTLPDYNPIYYTDCRDPTEIMKTSDGKYRIADGVSDGTALWEVDSVEEVFSNESWKYVGMLQSNNGGGYWECPDFFPLLGDNAVEGTWVSKYSNGGDWWYTGTYDEAAGVFTPYDDTPTTYDLNPGFYASKTFFDAKNNRRVLWGWMIGVDGDGTGWQSTQSVPRVVEASPNNGKRLVTYPIPELETLRNEISKVSAKGTSFQDAGATKTLPISGKMVDIEATIEFSAGSTGTCGVRVLSDTEDAAEYVYVMVSATDDACLDTNVNLYDPACSKSASSRKHASSITRTLRVMVDSSMVESFLDGGELSNWVQFAPTLDTSVGVVAAAGDDLDGSCTFTELKAWNMSPYKYDISQCEEQGCL